MTSKVLGAGLAGCEAAWQMANMGVNVTLIEMKPQKFSPAHHSANFAELVCSNSLRANNTENAVGLLKEEMRRLDSLIISCADATRVEAGGALAVDREGFSELITDKIKGHPNIKVENIEINEVPKDECVVVATGPLTEGALARDIENLFGKRLSFFDATAPIVTLESIDMDKAYYAARYDKGTADYINCPMNQEEYEIFYNELINAEVADLKEFEEKVKVFEGCMPVEVMAKRGKSTLLFGPLKPVGLPDTKTGKIPYAVVQLRKDNSAQTLYNIVGFQTHLKFGEQKRVFSLIPALKNAEFMRYGVMHRNTFIDSPRILTNTYETRAYKNMYFAGQITGVEGYVESASSGLVAGLNAARGLLGLSEIIFPKTTATGALCQYISDENVKEFQPMNVNFGLFELPNERYHSKKEKNSAVAKIALDTVERIKNEL